MPSWQLLVFSGIQILVSAIPCTSDRAHEIHPGTCLVSDHAAVIDEIGFLQIAVDIRAGQHKKPHGLAVVQQPQEQFNSADKPPKEFALEVNVKPDGKNAGEFAGLLFLYVLCCIVFEVRVAVTGDSSKAAGHSRGLEWDIVKLVLVACVIKLHLYNFVVCALTPDTSDIMERFSWFGVEFVLPAFAFVSGMFGRTLSANSLAKTVCYTLGASTIFSVCLSVVRFGFSSASLVPHFETWYLQALLIFRILSIPLLILSGPIRVVACAVLPVATSLTLLVLIPIHFPSFLDFVNVKATLFLAPFYALGLLLPASQWMDYAKVRPFSYACLGFVILWYAFLSCSHHFQQWADIACLAHGQCGNFTFPDSLAHVSGIYVGSVGLLFRIYLQKFFITIAMLVVLLNAVSCMQSQAPQLSQHLANSGTRTLHGYLLHWMIFVCLGSESGFYGHVAHSLHWLNFDLFIVFIWLLACFVTTCSLTGHLFDWMLRPYWLIDIGSAVICCTEADRKTTTTAALLDNKQKKTDPRNSFDPRALCDCWKT